MRDTGVSRCVRMYCVTIRKGTRRVFSCEVQQYCIYVNSNTFNPTRPGSSIGRAWDFYRDDGPSKYYPKVEGSSPSSGDPLFAFCCLLLIPWFSHIDLHFTCVLLFLDLNSICIAAADCTSLGTVWASNLRAFFSLLPTCCAFVWPRRPTLGL